MRQPWGFGLRPLANLPICYTVLKTPGAAGLGIPSMRKFFGGLFLAFYSAILIGASAAEPTFSWRFAGSKALSGSDKLITWKAITQLPEFNGFETNLIQRASEKLAAALTHGASDTNLANHLKPIVADLWAHPSIYELNKTDAAHQWTLAVKIPEANHQKWAASWDAITKANAADGAKLSREGEWTLLGNGDTKAILEKARAPFEDALHINGDASLLKKFFGNWNPTRAEMKVTHRGDGFRSEGKISFASDIPLQLEKWNIPTNTIREPIIGFTAAQGIGHKLAAAKIFGDKAPNQAFLWNEGVNPFTTMFAFKVDDPKKFIANAAATAQEKARLPMGSFELNPNSGALILKGLPIAVPYLKPAHTNDTGFVMAGLFPLDQFLGNPMPAELASEVRGRTNLVYYDWELTGERLQLWRPALQIAGMVEGKKLPLYTTPPHLWLTKASEKLGNAITEITLANPRELAFLRRSPTGFSAFELLQIVRWASGPAGEVPLTGAMIGGDPTKTAPSK